MSLAQRNQSTTNDWSPAVQRLVCQGTLMNLAFAATAVLQICDLTTPKPCKCDSVQFVIGKKAILISSVSHSI